MTNFIHIGSVLPRIPSLLTSQVLGFSQAVEYKALREYEVDIPGVVCAAFAKCLIRLHLAQPERAEPSDELISAHKMLDQLAASPETAVQDLVTDEIFENLSGPASALSRLEALFGPNALSLYKQWRGERRFDQA